VNEERVGSAGAPLRRSDRVDPAREYGAGRGSADGVREVYSWQRWAMTAGHPARSERST
jgi:hypothetical protein